MSSSDDLSLMHTPQAAVGVVNDVIPLSLCDLLVSICCVFVFYLIVDLFLFYC